MHVSQSMVIIWIRYQKSWCYQDSLLIILELEANRNRMKIGRITDHNFMRIIEGLLLRKTIVFTFLSLNPLRKVMGNLITILTLSPTKMKNKTNQQILLKQIVNNVQQQQWILQNIIKITNFYVSNKTQNKFQHTNLSNSLLNFTKIMWILF